MSSPGIVKVPLTPLHTWLGLAGYSLAAEAAGLLSAEPELSFTNIQGASQPVPVMVAAGADLGRYSDTLVERAVRKEAREVLVQRLPGFIVRYDSKYLEGIARKLCWEGSPSAMTLGDLAQAVAAAIRGDCDTDKAWSPVEPLLLARAENYRFLRTLGGPLTGGRDYDAAKALRYPALAQAVGLLGHWVTRVYSTGNKESLHIGLAPAPGGPSGDAAADARYASEVRVLASLASRVWGGDPPIVVLRLLAAAAAARLRASGERPRIDSLLVARLTYGQTVNLSWLRSLAASAPAGLILDSIVALADRWGMSRERRRVADVVYWAFRNTLEAVAGRPAGLSREQREALGRLPRLLEEYASHLILYADSRASGRGARDHAYAAARTAWGAAMAARRARLTGLMLPGARGPRAVDLAGEFRVLAELAGEAAALR